MMQVRPAFLDDPRLENWLKHLPGQARARLRGRLKSKVRREWLSALAELVWMQHAAASNWSYEPEPTLVTGGTPELLVSKPGPFYLEVKTAFDEIEVEMQNRGLLRLLDALEPLLQTGAWTLRLGNSFPIGYPVDAAVARVRSALAANPSVETIPCDDRELVVLERLAHSQASGILYSGHLSRWLPEADLITASLDAKASRYRAADLDGQPYVIALFTGDEQVIGLAGLADVLYGHAGALVAYRQGQPIGLVAAQRADGWFARAEVAHVSAVAFTRLGHASDPLRAESWICHNPHASALVAPGTFAPLPEAVGPQTAAALTWTTNTPAMRL
jgi:hypothetical protein